MNGEITHVGSCLLLKESFPWFDASKKISLYNEQGASDGFHRRPLAVRKKIRTDIDDIKNILYNVACQTK